MERIIVVVDLGHFKAFRVSTAEMESPRITLIESYDSLEAHGKLTEKLSDSAGRFKRSEGQKTNSKGYGEPHNIEIEMKKRLTKMIANDINGIIVKEGCSRWDLAAPETLSKQISKLLAPEVKAKLGSSITANLTKTDKSKILSYFE